MDIFKSTKVHPAISELEEGENSSSDESGGEDKTLSIQVQPVASVKKREIDWEEFLEDFDSLLDDRRGEKSKMFMLNGDPLKKYNSSGTTGLHILTNEILINYGLELLYSISDVAVDALDFGVSWTEVLKQLESFDYKKMAEEGDKKMFVWIDDQPRDEDDSKSSFCRLLVTELLRRGMEPEVILPCNDLEDDVLHDISKAVLRLELEFDGDKLPAKEHAKHSLEEPVQGASAAPEIALLFDHIVPKILRAVLYLSLAASKCKLVVIDVNRRFSDVKESHEFIDLVEQLGHKVLYLRNTPEVVDKNQPVNNIITKIISFMRKNEFDENPLLATLIEETEDEELSEADARKFMIEEDLEIGDFQELPKPSTKRSHCEIIHKLTPDHFVIDDDSDSSD